MGQSGESTGERVRGVFRIEWSGESCRFSCNNEWLVVDAFGKTTEIISRSDTKRLEDDEWTERTLLRMVRALAAETRAYTEERRDGVQRLL